jgi:hypothetical protein
VTTAPPVDSDEARGAAADRGATIVEFFEHAGYLWTIVLEDGRLDVTRMASVDTVREQVTRLRRDLRARAMLTPDSPMGAVLARATASSLAAVDTTLNPSGRASARVVIIPSRSLAAVPWSLLPSLAGRPVTVSPSLTRWVRGGNPRGGNSGRPHPPRAGGGAVRPGARADRPRDRRRAGRLVRRGDGADGDAHRRDER